MENDDGTKILCNLDQVIFELNPIRNELYKNQGTIYGGGHETINENNRNLKAKKKYVILTMKVEKQERYIEI